jgi:cytochrome P450
VLSRYADVAQVLKDTRFRVAEVAATVAGVGRASGKQTGDLASLLEAVLFLRNPPDHAEARRFLVAVLTATPLALHRPVIEAVAQGLLAPVAAGDTFDAITRYADLVPPLFMGRLLGLADSDTHLLVRTIAEVTMTFDRGRSPRFYERVNRTVTAALSVLLDAVASRRRHPAEDGLSRMIALSDSQFGLDDRTIATRALFLLIAGIETTSALIGNAIRAIAERPGLMRRLRADPALIGDAIEEVLRHDGPVQQATRLTTSDCTVGGQTIRAGERVVLLIGAAHRDPAAYDAPACLDIDRRGPANLGFGAGPHFCLGASLARLETRVAVDCLLPRTPLTRPDSHPDWWPHRTLRRLKSLDVVLTC